MTSAARDQHQTRLEGTRPGRRILEGPALTLVPESSWWGQQGGARPPSSTFQTPSQVPGVRGLPTEAGLSTLSAWAALLLGAHQGLAVHTRHARLLLRIRAALPPPRAPGARAVLRLSGSLLEHTGLAFSGGPGPPADAEDVDLISGPRSFCVLWSLQAVRHS